MNTIGCVELLALQGAMLRAGGNICPIKDGEGVADAEAEFAVLWSLNRRGLITWAGTAAHISAAGIEAARRQQLLVS